MWRGWRERILSPRLVSIVPDANSSTNANAGVEGGAYADLLETAHRSSREAGDLPGHQHQIPPMVLRSNRTRGTVLLLVPHLDGRATPKGVSCPYSSRQHVLADCSTGSG